VSRFISQIRELRPGSQVELSVTRDGDERIFRGELQSRREAFASQNQFRRSYEFERYPSDRGNWQTSYDEEERGVSQNNPRDPASRIEDLERQADRLARQLDELRDAIREARQAGFNRSRETPARYEENPSDRSRETRAYERGRDDQGRYQGDSDARSSRDSQRSESDRQRQGASQQRDSDDQWTDRSSRSSSNRADSDDSPGGETGGERLRVGSEDINE
jgi:hypothetical protein